MGIYDGRCVRLVTVTATDVIDQILLYLFARFICSSYSMCRSASPCDQIVKGYQIPTKYLCRSNAASDWPNQNKDRAPGTSKKLMSVRHRQTPKNRHQKQHTTKTIRKKSRPFFYSFVFTVFIFSFFRCILFPVLRISYRHVTSRAALRLQRPLIPNRIRLHFARSR
ncbi:hypothetical protein HDV62DRAFT_38722 [Trichoderma sp. SZMC 28011]